MPNKKSSKNILVEANFRGGHEVAPLGRDLTAHTTGQPIE